MTLSELPGRTRAYIKIQDGCNQFCTYCVIPYARGRIRSRDMEDILSEIKGLVNKGCKEVVLTGIHISSYGVDKGESAIIDLVEKINDIEGLERVRLSSLEPRIIGPEGGFSEEEVALAKENGVLPITLGKRILRTETAGFTIISWLMYHLEG